MVVEHSQRGQVHLYQQGGRRKSPRPGTALGSPGKRWITVDQGLELLDTPEFWPKFEDETIGLHLAFTGAVPDAIMDVETLACHLQSSCWPSESRGSRSAV